MHIMTLSRRYKTSQERRGQTEEGYDRKVNNEKTRLCVPSHAPPPASKGELLSRCDCNHHTRSRRPARPMWMKFHFEINYIWYLNHLSIGVFSFGRLAE